MAASEAHKGEIRDTPPDFVGGNVFDKYRTKNPLYRLLVGGFFDGCRELLQAIEARRVLEVGCGPGDLAHRLSGAVPWFDARRYLGCDVAVDEVAAGSAQYPAQRFFAGSIYRLPVPDGFFDCVVACEIFEHLEHPEAALAEVERVCSGHLLLSVPWEPTWRLLNIARGRYLKNLGNTPGHVQNYSRAAIRRLVASRFEVIAERRPLPWTMLLARRRPGSRRPGPRRPGS